MPFNTEYLDHNINWFSRSYLAQIPFYKAFYSGMFSKARSRNYITLQTWQSVSIFYRKIPYLAE